MQELRVLCFGDSNTWGCVPIHNGDSLRRYNKEQRWTALLEKKLGPNATVINAGLNSRTTSPTPFYEEVLKDVDRRAVETFVTFYNCALPLDVLIIMLGTNDVRDGVEQDPNVTANRIAKMIADARKNTITGSQPKVLVISPVPLRVVEGNDINSSYAKGRDKTLAFSKIFEKMAKDAEAYFLDASTVIPEADGCDGAHLSELAHKKLADAIYAKVNMMLNEE